MVLRKAYNHYFHFQNIELIDNKCEDRREPSKICGKYSEQN